MPGALVRVKQKAMVRGGSQSRKTSSPTMPPCISTVRVVPTAMSPSAAPGLVQVTLVIAVAQCGQASASASTSKSCSGVIARSTLLVKRAGAAGMWATSTRRVARISRATQQPPATAGMTETCTPSGVGVARSSRKRTSSLPT